MPSKALFECENESKGSRLARLSCGLNVEKWSPMRLKGLARCTLEAISVRRLICLSIGARSAVIKAVHMQQCLAQAVHHAVVNVLGGNDIIMPRGSGNCSPPHLAILQWILLMRMTHSGRGLYGHGAA